MRSTSFDAIGTTAHVVVTEDDGLDAARGIVERQLHELDLACSRFRPDSELARANAQAGSVVAISPLLAELVGVALAAAVATEGRVDPTLGADLRSVGYDRTFRLVRDREHWTIAPPRARQPLWADVRLDQDRLTLEVPAGVELDLGATAKAWAADRAANAVAARLATGVLVSLGGDIAVAGPPPVAGWPIRIADDHRAPLDTAGPVVAIEHGGLATSSTTVRRWPTDDGEAHHLLDPATGHPAESSWRTVSVAADTCLDANVAATASIVLSEAAPSWLAARRLPARLVRVDGTVVDVGGWPSEQRAA